MMEDAARRVAAVAGEMSLALVRRAARRHTVLGWARMLREVAAQLEDAANRRGAGG